MMARAAGLALAAGLIGLATNRPGLAAGAAGGTLVAGVYAAAYIHSHLRERQRAFDRPAASATALRLVMVAIGGTIAWLAGKPVLIAYLVAFAAGFAVLVVWEIPRITLQLRNRGMLP